jgi:putative hemolysin
MASHFEIAIFVFGLLASAFFSGAEAALMSIPVDRTKQLIEGGGRRGKAFQFLIDRPNEILTTILVGNNVVNIFVAAYATNIAHRYFQDDVVAISAGITTIFILLFGEIIPKTFARTRAEALAYFCITTLQLIYFLFFPVIKIFMLIISAVLGKNANLVGKIVTKEDLEYMVNRAEKEKSIDSKQIDLLNSILEFPMIKVKDIMVPRTEVQGIKRQTTFPDIINLIRDVAHSRYPVFEEDLDDTIGFLHVKDLAFVTQKDQENFDVTRYLKEPFFVYEHMKIQAVFDHMNRKKVHLALVKDENGLVVGIITLEDIMEEIFGEIQDEHDDDEDEVNPHWSQMKHGIVMESKISLRDLYNEYDIQIPLNDNYSTLNGFLLERLGNSFPKNGQMIIWDNYTFELTKVVDHEIEEVTVKALRMNEVTVVEEQNNYEIAMQDSGVQPTQTASGVK